MHFFKSVYILLILKDIQNLVWQSSLLVFLKVCSVGFFSFLVHKEQKNTTQYSGKELGLIMCLAVMMKIIDFLHCLNPTIISEKPVIWENK